MARDPNPELLLRPEKRCPRCGVVKPRDEFYKATKMSDGLSGYCKPCMKANAVAWQKANPEKKKESDRKTHARPEAKQRRNERTRDRYATDEAFREESKRRSIEHGRKHPELLLERNRRYFATEAGKRRRAARNATPYYKYAHRLRESFYRSQKHGHIPRNGHISAHQWFVIVMRFEMCCAYCRSKVRLTMDHMTPLSRGGPHTIGNIVPACQSCNSKKRAMTIQEYRGKLRFNIKRILRLATAPIEEGEYERYRAMIDA